MEQPVDWKEVVLSHWMLIDRMAKRRFARLSLAEEAALFVLEGLQENDWQRVRDFRGKASLTAYLATLTYRLLEDFARRRFGRLRPPGWIRRLGGIWVLLFGLLCGQRLKAGEAVEHVRLRMPSEKRPDLENAAAMILAKITDCGRPQEAEVPLDEESACPEAAGCTEQYWEEKERQLLFSALLNGVFAAGADDAVSGSLARVVATGVQLEGQDRLLLRLCFQDGASVTEAGRMLGINRFQVHGRLRRLLVRLRRDLEAMGISDALLDFLRD